MEVDSLSGVRRSADGLSRVDWFAIVLLWLFAGVVLTLLSREVAAPTHYLDEFLYWGLAKSFAAGDGLTWRGMPSGLRSTLYPVLISPAFDLASGVEARYRGVQTINSFMVSSAIVPTYLMARAYVGRRAAFLAVGFVLVSPVMVYAGVVAQENLAYPVATMALAACLLALAAPSWKHTLLAFALIVVATYVRIQLIVLLPALVGALILRTAMLERETRREYVRSQLPLVVMSLGAASLLGLAALIEGRGIVGVHLGVLEGQSVSLEAVRFWGRTSLADIWLVAGIVPAVATFAMFGDGENRRDPRVGSLLALTAAATLCFFLQVTWFSARVLVSWNDLHEFFERYLVYLGPLFFTGFVASRGRVSFRAASTSAVLGTVVVSLLGLEAIRVPFSIDAFGFSYIGFLLDQHEWIGHHLGLWLGAFAAILGAAYVLGCRPGRVEGSTNVPAVIAIALSAAFLGFSSAKSWSYLEINSAGARAMLPGAEAVDRASEGPVGLLFAEGSKSARTYQLEFFNPSITSVWTNPDPPVSSPPFYTGACRFRWSADGFLLKDSRCSPPPRNWLIEGGLLSLAFRDQVSSMSFTGALAGARDILVETRGRPRLLAIVSGMDSETGVVHAHLDVTTFLDSPGWIMVEFSDGRRLRRGVEASEQTVRLVAQSDAAQSRIVSRVAVRERSGKWRTVAEPLRR